MKKAFISIIFLLTFISLLFSQQSYSKELEQLLLQDKYSLEIELLKGSLSLDFPYNIIVSAKNQLLREKNKNKICIIISQDYAYKNYNTIRLLFEALDTSSYPFEILLSANDAAIHPSLAHSLQGIKSYIENQNDFTAIHAIIIDSNIENSKKALNLEIGCKNHLTPRALTKAFTTILEKNRTPYAIKGSFSSFIRLGFTNDNPRLAYLLENEIPALAIHTQENNLSLAIALLLVHIKTFNPEILDEGSSQYNFFYIFKHFFSISEFHLISMIIILAFLTLLIIVFFPFSLGKNRFLHKQELAKSWPLLPLLILTNALFFYASQNLLGLLFPHVQSLPQFAFLIKLILSLLFLFLISLAQILFKFPLSSFIYGYLGTFISFINIIIFTFVDISLFIPFSFEFLVLLLTSNFKKKKGLFLTLVFMLLPFLPYIIFTDNITRNNLLHFANHSDLLGNIFLALFLIPFQIIWIKILIRMKHFGKQKGVTYKRILIDLLMNLGAILSIIVLIQILIHTNIISQEHFIKPKDIIISDNKFIQTSSKQRLNYDTQDTELLIESSLPVLRYEIKIHTPSILPIYEANFPYDILTEQEWALLSLDDYPPSKLILRFSSHASLDTRVFIKAYLQNEDEVLMIQEQIFFRGSDESI